MLVGAGRVGRGRAARGRATACAPCWTSGGSWPTSTASFAGRRRADRAAARRVRRRPVRDLAAARRPADHRRPDGAGPHPDRAGRGPARVRRVVLAGPVRRRRGQRRAPAPVARRRRGPAVLRRRRPARPDRRRGRAPSRESSPGCPELQGILAGSVLSPLRLGPATGPGRSPAGGWRTGRPRCGCARTRRGNPHGANVELKCIDGSANPYLAAAAFLGLALDGIAADAPAAARGAGRPGVAARGAARRAGARHARGRAGRAGVARPGPRAARRRDRRRRPSRCGGTSSAPTATPIPRTWRRSAGWRSAGDAARLRRRASPGCRTSSSRRWPAARRPPRPRLLRGAGDRPEFEESLNEGSTDPIPPYMTQFDSQLGFAVRRWCAPLLGLEPARRADEYWAPAGRAGRGRAGAPRCCPPRGWTRWMVDTGLRGGRVARRRRRWPPGRAASCREVLRLETLGEELLAAGVAPRRVRRGVPRAAGRPRAGSWAPRRSSPTAAGSTSTGAAPPDAAVAAEVAAGPRRRRAADDVAAAGRVRRSTRPRDAGLPMQLHVGLGDRDLDLHRVDPLLLLGAAAAAGGRPGAGAAAALLPVPPPGRLPGPGVPERATATSGWPSTTSARGRSRSSPSRWSWRRSPGSCTPPTPGARPSCTCSARCCGVARWRACWAGGCARATGRSRTRCGWCG